MTTFVGKQVDFASAMIELLELEYDAIEAYQAAINRIENHTYKDDLVRFKLDHDKHIKSISTILLKYKDKNEIPQGPTGKQWLTKGKVVLANIAGDKGIITAMISNEMDTNKAYENMNSRPDKWPESIPFLIEALNDEKHHKSTLESLL